MSRAQTEIMVGAVAALALLWLYRSYLERSLAMQQDYCEQLLAEHRRERAAAAPTNGAGPQSAPAREADSAPD